MAWLAAPGLFWIVVGMGVSLRIYWAITRPASAIGEAANVALAIADGRGFAEAYHVGQGPTAHLLPTMPLLAGGVYGLLGTRSIAAEAVLFALATLFTIGSFIFLARAFARLGTPTWARTLALAYLCLLSPYLADEVISFRVWEGALAGFLAAIMLYLLIGLDLDPTTDWRRYLPLPLVGALTFFVQPLIGIGCYLASVVLVVRRLSPVGWVRLGVVGALALAALLGPWTVRNAIVMGKPIPLRSNAGLELAISMYPGAVNPGPDPRETFNARLREVHPQQSIEAYQRMRQAGGEVRYAAMLGNDAKAWMRDHPADVVRLALRHLRETYVPPTWITRQENQRMVLVRTLLVDAVGVFGLLGLVTAQVLRREHWIYPALVTLIPRLIFTLFQPIPRYDYLFFGLLTFAAADFIASIVGKLAARQRDMAGLAMN
jgi:hypothetical protein